MVREESGGSIGRPEWVGRPSRKSGRSREALSEIRKESGVPPESPGEIGMPSQKSLRGR